MKEAKEGMEVGLGNGKEKGIIKCFDHSQCVVWFPSRYSNYGDLMIYSWNEMRTEFEIDIP